MPETPCSATDGFPSPTRLTAAVRHVLRDRPDIVRRCLTGLIAHPDELAEIAEQSYWHTNGFAKIRLSIGEHVTVRLHVWPAGGLDRGEWDPHGHRWNFASWIVAGDGIVETSYTETPGEEPRETLDLVRFRYDRADGAERLTETGETKLYVLKQDKHLLGDVYGCGIDRVHTVAPVGCDLVATMVVQGPQRVDSTAVYLPPDTPPFGLGRPLPPDELGELLAEVVGRIDGASPPA